MNLKPILIIMIFTVSLIFQTFVERSLNLVCLLLLKLHLDIEECQDVVQLLLLFLWTLKTSNSIRILLELMMMIHTTTMVLLMITSMTIYLKMLMYMMVCTWINKNHTLMKMLVMIFKMILKMTYKMKVTSQKNSMN